MNISVKMGTDALDFARSYASMSYSEIVAAVEEAISNPDGITVEVGESGQESTRFLLDGVPIGDRAAINAAFKKAGFNFVRAYADAFGNVVDGGERGIEPITNDAESAALVSVGSAGADVFTLTDAAEFGALLTTMALLRAGHSASARDSYGTPALTLAVQHIEPEIVRLLLAAGADINAQDADGKTALDWAKADEWNPAITHILQGVAKAA